MAAPYNDLASTASASTTAAEDPQRWWEAAHVRAVSALLPLRRFLPAHTQRAVSARRPDVESAPSASTNPAQAAAAETDPPISWEPGCTLALHALSPMRKFIPPYVQRPGGWDVSSVLEHYTHCLMNDALGSLALAIVMHSSSPRTISHSMQPRIGRITPSIKRNTCGTSRSERSLFK